MELLLLAFQFLQTNDGGCYFDGRSGCVGQGTSATRLMHESWCHLSSFRLNFAAERARVLCMLAYFSFVYYFPKGGNNNRSHIYHHSKLLGVFNHVPTKEVWALRVIFASLGSCMGLSTREPCRECLWMKTWVLKINFTVSCSFPFQQIALD